jgi:hypothetical protein
MDNGDRSRLDLLAGRTTSGVETDRLVAALTGPASENPSRLRSSGSDAVCSASPNDRKAVWIRQSQVIESMVQPPPVSPGPVDFVRPRQAGRAPAHYDLAHHCDQFADNRAGMNMLRNALLESGHGNAGRIQGASGTVTPGCN